MPAAALQINRLNKTFLVDQNEIPVLEDIQLEIKSGEFITILGHSGCGKSTLLKIIAGLVPYESGNVSYNGIPIQGPGTDRGMVFQEHRLLPWLKIKDNVGLGLFGLSKEERSRRVEEYLALVKLEGFGNAYPKQLSGGMAQRAAIARALVTNPEILLLDEPFGALDALTRIQMQKEVLRIWEQEQTTMILVTHDIDEAIYLGQRVVVMSARPGRIKAVIDTDSAATRDRASTDFAHIKKRIYQYFFEEEVVEPEYVL
ncbi:MAG: transporter related [Paenibacillaceae bacterium]|jgi:ABC-type nitrate/sulfonate/bicarbonate transport system ATPase subunit|nr:transporter related [Paenibacillaceae bacterium]